MRSTDEEKDDQIAAVRAFQDARRRPRRAAALARLQRGRAGARQRLRGADGGGQGRLAGPDLGRALRGRRRVPAQHVAWRDERRARASSASSRASPSCSATSGWRTSSSAAPASASTPGRRCRTIPKVGGTKDVKHGPRSGSSRRPTSSSTSTRTARRTPRRWPSSSPNVVVTHPLAPRDNLGALPADGRDLRASRPRRSGSARSSSGLRSARSRARGAERDVLYLIWRDPWMTIAPDTYISQTLALFNWRTLPAAPTERYPEVDLADFAGRSTASCSAASRSTSSSSTCEEVASARPGRRGLADRRRDDLLVRVAGDPRPRLLAEYTAL